MQEFATPVSFAVDPSESKDWPSIKFVGAESTRAWNAAQDGWSLDREEYSPVLPESRRDDEESSKANNTTQDNLNMILETLSAFFGFQFGFVGPS